MKPTTSLRTIGALALAGLALTTLTAPGQTLDRVSTSLISTGNSNAKISVFPGKAGFESASNVSPTVSGAFGDGTVTDYRFVNNGTNGGFPSNEFRTYADGGAGRIAMPTCGSGNLSGDGQNWADAWTATDPGDPLYSSTADFPNPWRASARCAQVDGTIDMTTHTGAGSLYV
ncbi:MAG: hypothetical protein HKN82_04615, partial [Akkermansiaceae bacterium]|nr:hypothetical protein [Akkermansiaceae bacterium]